MLTAPPLTMAPNAATNMQESKPFVSTPADGVIVVAPAATAAE
jgi:hypothetical protein